MNYTFNSYYVNTGKKSEQTISEEEYKNLNSAMNLFIDACQIEEKFAYVIDNFIELEESIFSYTMKSVSIQYRSSLKSLDSIHQLSRRIVNLLTTCRLYLDQVNSHLVDMSTVSGESNRELWRDKFLKKPMNYMINPLHINFALI